MKHQSCLWILGIFLLRSAALAQTESAEESIDTLLEAGKQRIAKLPVLAPGDKWTSYFEIHMGPRNAIGYIVASIRAVQAGDETEYAYASDTVMKAQTGAQIRAKMKARLRTNFEPIEVEMSRGNLFESGEKKFAVVKAEFGPSEVTLTSGGAAAAGPRKHPRPEPPVIFAVEMLVQHLDLEDKSPFALREYSANAAAAGVLKFRQEAWKDGTPTLVTNYELGDVGYQFWFDAEGKLLRWTHLTMPVLFVRSTVDQVAEVRAKLGDPLEIEIPEPSQEGAEEAGSKPQP